MKRFFERVQQIANFMNLSYPKSWSNPFRGTGDTTRREAAVTLIQQFWDAHSKELSHKGKIPKEQIAGAKVLIPPGATSFYALLPKSFFDALNRDRKLKLTIYPDSWVWVTYNHVSTQTQSSGAPNNG